MDKKSLLSTLWLLAVLNYLFRFTFSLYYSERLQELLSGSLHGMEATQGLLLGISVMMELPIAMILLSRLLEHRKNRMLNVILAVLMSVVHLSSLSTIGTTLHFRFFSIVGIMLYLGIIVVAVKWKTGQTT